MRNVKTLGAVLAATLLPGLALAGTSDVVMQGFHWKSTQQVGWYNTVKSKAGELGTAGFNHVWLPPPSKSGAPQGYLPTELNVLDSSYGTELQLKDAISALNAAGVSAVADIVVNHRNGSTAWHDFRNPDWGTDSIASNDECWTTAGSTCTSGMTRGAADTGEPYNAARDVDHSKQYVRDSLVAWMGTRLGNVGFDGWRFDFVKGFHGSYVGEYVTRTTPTFCVGEFWPTNYFDVNNPSNWRNQITGWVDATGSRCSAFDFVTKALLNQVLANGDYGRLKTADGKPAGTIGVRPAHSVTFVDNHDTGPSEACGDGQNHWPVPCDKVMAGYAYILTHPGVPTVYWTHYYNFGLKTQIDKLISIRKTKGLQSESVVNIVRAEQNLYAAIIDAKVAMKIGSGSWDPGTGWTLAASGADYAVWTQGTTPPPPPGCTQPSMNLRGTFNNFGNAAMTCKGSNTWEITNVTFGGAATDRFKFDVFGDWSRNYGDNNNDGIAELTGADISLTTAGTYTLQFNDSTLRYTVTRISTPPPTGASVRFYCQNGTTVVGQNVHVVGNIPELGSWDVAKSIKMDPTTYPTWDKLVALPASTRIEWKCVKVAPNTAPVWQGGANNVVTTPASGTVTATASF